MSGTVPGAPAPRDPEREEREGAGRPVIRDKRRLDPETGEVRRPPAPTPPPDAPAGAADLPPDAPAGAAGGDNAVEGVGDAIPGEGDAHPDTRLAADRLEDLRRLQAEYVNYRRRVERDRDVQRNDAVGSVVTALLPVLDDLHSAREHGDLTDGPMAAIADKLEATLGRYGVERVGQVGDPFDPNQHEALMHLPGADLPEGAEGTTVVQVVQPGFRIGERVVRAARVAVADPPEVAEDIDP